MADISKHQKFVMERWARSAIKAYPNNPRTISEGARKKLKGKMAEQYISPAEIMGLKR